MKPNEIEKCLHWLEQLAGHGAGWSDLDEQTRVRLLTVTGHLSRPDKETLRRRNKGLRRERRKRDQSADRTLRQATGIREARSERVFRAPQELLGVPEDLGELKSARKCYICKADYTRLHFFYDALCLSCAELNYRKRFQTAPLDGQVAVVTGARVKIGFQVALSLLRAGAYVVATTRFPVDASDRFAQENDFSTWRHRLEVHGLDLRHTPSVELFANLLVERLPHLDILINNAAQTVRRPPGFYAHLLAGENQPRTQLTPERLALIAEHENLKQRLRALPHEENLPVMWNSPALGLGLLNSAELSQLPYTHEAQESEDLFPLAQRDADRQQVDRRSMNSWRLGLSEVATAEMLEVHLVNAVAPFVLCSRLTPLMRKHRTGQKHIVNVSAMEGKFTRFTKTDKHPHTNMAKAALNMMTLTSSRELIRDGIHMNAVDTGWVTDEDPLALSLRKQLTHDFQPPLDIVDGAARICDPIYSGMITGQHWHGRFLKDYFPTDW